MNLSTRKKTRGKLVGSTPATLALAVLFTALCLYFIVESYFLQPEQYAGNPPFLLMAAVGLATVVGAFFALAKIEPSRNDTLSYALLLGFGCMLFLYPFLTRVNFWLDDGSLEAHVYVLNADYAWEAKDAATPDINMYIENSVWWQQFKPGDEYTFKLRQGGLGFWQVNMTEIYDDQVRWVVHQMIDGQFDSGAVAAAGYQTTRRL